MKCPHCGKKLPPNKVRARCGRSRWEGMSAEERSAATSQAAKARWAGMTQAERSEAASQAAKARWAAVQTTKPNKK